MRSVLVSCDQVGDQVSLQQGLEIQGPKIQLIVPTLGLKVCVCVCVRIYLDVYKYIYTQRLLLAICRHRVAP